jgi:hypothetical protein
VEPSEKLLMEAQLGLLWQVEQLQLYNLFFLPMQTQGMPWGVEEQYLKPLMQGRPGILYRAEQATCLHRFAFQMAFCLYPNPSFNKITIANTTKLPGETMISVFNMKGEQIIQGKFQNQTPIDMDVSTLAKGIYLVKIQTKAGVESKKLVIQ